MATGCIKQYPTSGAVLSRTSGATSIDAAASINTGLTSVKRTWAAAAATQAGTQVLCSATGGATFNLTPGADGGQTIWWFADGYE